MEVNEIIDPLLENGEGGVVAPTGGSSEGGDGSISTTGTSTADLGPHPEKLFFGTEKPHRRKVKKMKKFKKYVMESNELNESQLNEIKEYCDTLDEGVLDMVKYFLNKTCKPKDEKCKEKMSADISASIGGVAEDFFTNINKMAKKFNMSAAQIYKEMMKIMGNTSLTMHKVRQYLIN
jgi:hypothetical protein